MQTILETYYSLVRSKMKVLKCKFFCRWKDTRKHIQFPLYKQVLDKLQALDEITMNQGETELSRAFSHWKSVGIAQTLAHDYRVKFAAAKTQFRSQISELQNQCEYLSSKKHSYRSELEQYRDQERAFKSKLCTPDVENVEISALKAENHSLKQRLAYKEQQILNYFAELTEMVTRVKIRHNPP